MINKTVCLIANNNLGRECYDGQRVKTREYIKIFDSLNIHYELVDIAFFKRNPFKAFHQIKKGIKNNDVVVFMSASRGVKILLPFINHYKIKYRKRLVMPLVGSSVLNFYLNTLNETESRDFFLGKDSSKCKDKRLIKNLKSIDLILPETELLSQRFKDYYSLNNVKTLVNLRYFSNSIESKGKNGKYVFLSRIMRKKGIFDLLEAIVNINKTNKEKIYLDIYGEVLLNNEDKEIFESKVDNNFISYKGSLNPDKVIYTLARYNYLVFPTQFVSEGIPGVIVESLIAGTPVISSNYPQVKYLLTENEDSILFEMGNIELLERVIIKSQKIDVNEKLIEGSIKNGKRYLFVENRDSFISCIFGD